MADFDTAVRAFRAAVETAPQSERAAFARRTRNAVAATVVAGALGPVESGSGGPAPPDLCDAVRTVVGDDALAAELVALYDNAGCDFERRWAGAAVEVLEPLHRLARSD